MWRSVGPESERTSLCVAGLLAEFTDDELRALSLEGGNLIRQYGGLYSSSVGIMEGEMRHMAQAIDFARANRESFPSKYPRR